MCFRKVVLSASPASGSICMVAAISRRTLALWHPGMTSWCVYRSFGIDVSSDISFYQFRIYMVSTYFPKEPLRPVEGCVVKECHIVEWRGKLVLIIMYADSHWANSKIRKSGYMLWTSAQTLIA